MYPDHDNNFDLCNQFATFFQEKIETIRSKIETTQNNHAIEYYNID